MTFDVEAARARGKAEIAAWLREGKAIIRPTDTLLAQACDEIVRLHSLLLRAEEALREIAESDASVLADQVREIGTQYEWARNLARAALARIPESKES